MFNGARYRQWQWAFGMTCLFYGAVFFILGHWGINAMEPALYGEVAVSGRIEDWATLQLSLAFILCMGIAMNGAWRWSAAARLAGSAGLVFLLFVLGASAFSAENGWPVGIFCTGFAAVQGFPVVWWNLVDLIGAFRWGKNG